MVGAVRTIDGLSRQIGLSHVGIFLADTRQTLLVPLTLPSNGGQGGLSIEGSLGGTAFRTTSMRVSADLDGELEVWLPLLNGVERIGVLQVRTPTLDSATLNFSRMLASLVTMLVLTKGAHSDDYSRAQRSEHFSLPSEMVWAFLPPRTLGTDRVVSTAVLEPADELGGDAFDHSLIGNGLHNALERPPELPLGLGHLSGVHRRVQTVQLQPGDRVLFYSDGIIEALSKTGERFGLDNFIDFIVRATAAGVTTYEVLRLLIRAILRCHNGHQQDDATILLFEWRDPSVPPSPDQNHEHWRGAISPVSHSSTKAA